MDALGDSKALSRDGLIRLPSLLKLAVEDAKNRKQEFLPPGIAGITSVIDHYIDSVDGKLAVGLDFDPEANVVRRGGLLALAELMVEQDSEWLTREEARRALDSHTFFRGLREVPIEPADL